MDYRWPGNVRELENVIERACVLAKGALIQLEDMPDFILNETVPSSHTAGAKEAGEAESPSLKDALKDPEKKIILDALEKCSGNKKEAAKLLGINRTTLYKKLGCYKIDLSEKSS